ncbi:hypothetical protein [Chitinophaga sp. LS1]|uniref:hypothetical protein n=1 Tax=Chitinophaga sp. LS1 TaxID=3051176 RepID=UPI002AABED75|nr:hypothetical protein [Chitinophaga sp. LS1]WPV69978.1 hypothetical protein QQL36_14840 [Chitinophaga sp. LS1]
MKTTLSILLIFICSLNGFAQKKWMSEVPKQIIIVRSTKSYEEALTAAKDAAKKLGKKLDLRELSPNAKTGLTLSEAACKTGGSDEKDFPYYPARGDGNADNDDYISVEYSNAYKHLSGGYYIVVAGIQDVEAKKLLAEVKAVFKDAYGKRTMVWYGPMD